MARNQHDRAILLALLAAALYGINQPLSKLLLRDIQPAMMASLLYLGAFLGMSGVGLLNRRQAQGRREQPLGRKDLPAVVGMILLDIAAPLCLMIGLGTTLAANAALLNNFEIVATALFALLFFHERLSGRLWTAIGLVSLASILLTLEGAGSFRFSSGSALVLLASVFWGLENNCTRVLSAKDPLQIVMLKGLGSGMGALLVALSLGEPLPAPLPAASALLLGFVSYGLSIACYVRAQRDLGAARTSAYYAIAPFVGAALSLLLFRRLPQATFLPALALMAAGAWVASSGKERA
ncbi:MAG: DMT family transporter [Christensenellales bacterium]